MDLVLGLSMTSADLRWVLVEGATAEGATVCRDSVDCATLDDVLSAVGDDRLHAVGVTWTAEAEDAASTLLDALADRGLGNVIAVSDVEAAEALATGIADRGGYDDVAVCVAEPDDVLVTRVEPDGVTTERAGRSTEDMLALLGPDDGRPTAMFVLGSADDVEAIVSSFEDVCEAPVITAAEADLALARGAALASAQAVNALDAPRAGIRWPSKTAALASVLAAAAVTFVISLSIAVGLTLTPDSTVAQRQAAGEEPAKVATVTSVPQASPKAPPPAAPPPPRPAAPPTALPKEAQKIAVAATPVPDAPPPAAEPVYDPPAAAQEPAPVYVPPAPVPAYVPPPPQPRLRDRIIERIPIINRFHEPNPYG